VKTRERFEELSEALRQAKAVRRGEGVHRKFDHAAVAQN
jgi:hypothetical protein